MDGHATFQDAAFDSLMPDVEDIEQANDVDQGGRSGSIRHEDSSDDEEEEDEEDDEEDDEESVCRKGKKRAKHRHKRSAASRFVDLEAEVSDEEEEEEEEEEYGPDGFIDTTPDGDDEGVGRRSHNALLDRKRDKELDEGDLQKIAQDLSKRYGGRAAVRYTGDMNEVPQRLLMPSVHDASLWQVRVKPGRERDIVFSLMRKSIDVEHTAHPLQIFSAFQRDSLQGIIYIEARSSQQVTQACHGLIGVYPSRGIQLVPIEEMASLLQIKKQELTITPGSWVRIKRGKYQGDLAQVMDITENGEEVGLKFIPRIDLTPREDESADFRKRKKTGTGSATMRPPQCFFNYEEVVKVWGRKQVSKRNQMYVFQNDTYKDGFVEKDFKPSGIVLENVNPTLDEITRFTGGQDGTEHANAVDLSVIAEVSRKAAISVLQPGDHIEVFEGEQAGVHGIVMEVSQDVVTITALGIDIDGQKVILPARSVRKRFKPGDHVKVMRGQNADESGLVVAVTDNVVTFLSDMSMQEVSVFSKDVREAAEVGSGTNIVGNYELHDLVQLDVQTVGVIFKTEKDSFRVLDQNNQVRLVRPHQISMRRDSRRAIATDSGGYELRINDNMKEIDGDGRKGSVLHIHQSFFAFLHSRDIAENGGVFVMRARSLASIAPKGNLVKNISTDLSKINPSLATPTGGMVGSGNMGRGPRDWLVGVAVAIVKGPRKGYIGTIKDTNGPIARVELHAGNKVVTIEKDKLREQLPDGKLGPLEGRNSSGGGQMGPPPLQSSRASEHTSNPYAPAAQTPGWGGASRTPNPYASGSQTPAWNVSSRTPNPYGVDISKTPAWTVSSRTPNPYTTPDGGRTPAWNGKLRTPNPYSNGVETSETAESGWGGATPGPISRWGDDLDAEPTMSVTLHAAPTTPLVINAPTPAAYTADDEDFYEPPEMWLTDPKFYSHLSRIRVQVKGTRAPKYRDGNYEHKVGTVITSVTVGEGFSQCYSVRFDDAHPDDLPVGIKAEYLVPISPKDVGEHVLVADGEYKGKSFIIREKGDSFTVSTKEEPEVTHDVPKTDLILLTMT